jgi:ribose transport system ATP-binding protein
MSLVPSDRNVNAAISTMTMRENLTLGDLRGVSTRLGIKARLETVETERWMERLRIHPRRPEALLSQLSGGNQQKVMLARSLRRQPKVLILDEPTQGVDVGAKDAIHEIVRGAATEGAAILVVSSETEELLAVCDRVIVMVAGVAIADRPVDSLTLTGLTALIMGAAVEA